MYQARVDTSVTEPGKNPSPSTRGRERVVAERLKRGWYVYIYIYINRVNYGIRGHKNSVCFPLSNLGVLVLKHNCPREPWNS